MLTPGMWATLRGATERRHHRRQALVGLGMCVLGAALFVPQALAINWVTVGLAVAGLGISGTALYRQHLRLRRRP